MWEKATTHNIILYQISCQLSCKCFSSVKISITKAENVNVLIILMNNGISPLLPSSETQGQLVGTTRFSWAKVYNKSGRAPGHLLLLNKFQKRLKSRLLIGQKNIFLANQRRGTAGRLSCLLIRGCFPHRTP